MNATTRETDAHESDSAELRSQAQIVPIDRLVESPLNPRKHFDPVTLGELANSMLGGVGIIAPLVVRRNGTPGTFEVIDGARRLRAAQLAGVTEAPIVIRDLSDVQVLELMLVANNQRDDVHPLEEADGYAALMQAGASYTVEAIALKVGKSASYVYQRLKLLQLTDEAKQAFYDGTITIAHAVRLARLTPEQQGSALAVCFVEDLFHRDTDRREPAPVHTLDRWIASHVREQVKAEDTAHYYPELFAAVEALQEEAPGAKLLELSESYHVNQDLGTKKHGAIGRGRWLAIDGPRDRCAHVQRGVVVHGGPMRILEVCASKGCPKHFPAPKMVPGSETDPNGVRQSAERREAEQKRWEAERAAEQAREDAWKTLYPKLLAAFADHVKGLKVTPALLQVALRERCRPRSWTLSQAMRATGGITVRNLGQVLAVYAFVNEGSTWYVKSRLAACARKFKFDLTKAIKQIEAAEPPAAKKKSTAARKASKKGRRS